MNCPRCKLDVYFEKEEIFGEDYLPCWSCGIIGKERVMPIYVFKCLNCYIELEQHFAIGDEPLMRCSECKVEMFKQFTPPAVHFKGDGWGGQ